MIDINATILTTTNNEQKTLNLAYRIDELAPRLNACSVHTGGGYYSVAIAPRDPSAQHKEVHFSKTDETDGWVWVRVDPYTGDELFGRRIEGLTDLSTLNDIAHRMIDEAVFAFGATKECAHFVF